MANLPVGEIFAHPTVSQVIFQIQFPTLLFIPAKVGDLQIRLMPRFPHTKAMSQRGFIFARSTDSDQIREIADKQRGDDIERIWTFSDDEGITVEVKTSALTIVSKKHKSFRHGDDSFRSLIRFVLDQFLEEIPIPLVSRLGLRYVDECPFPELTTASFKSYFNTCLPVDRFHVEDCIDMTLIAVARRESPHLRYSETIQSNDKEQKLVLDMDAFSEALPVDGIMAGLDELHRLLRENFEHTIKEPVINYMRTGHHGE